jgi:cytochrome b561
MSNDGTFHDRSTGGSVASSVACQQRLSGDGIFTAKDLSMTSAPIRYSIIQKALHWATVVLVMFNLLLPGSIEKVADLLDDGKTPAASDSLSANLHIYAGITILCLTLLRLVVRLVQGAPDAPVGEPDAFHLIGKITHGLIYAILLVMPALGIAKYFLGVDAAGDWHGGPAKVALWTLIGLHVGAVLVHQFYWKTNALARMTNG